MRLHLHKWLPNCCKLTSARQAIPECYKPANSQQAWHFAWGLLIKWEGVVCCGGANRSYLLSRQLLLSSFSAWKGESGENVTTLWKPGWLPTVKWCDLWDLQMTVNTFRVFHLCLWSFAINSSPTTLRWFCCFLFEEAYVTARVPFLKWKPFRSSIKKENNLYRIRNSTVYVKKPLSLPPNQLSPLRTCCCLPKHHLPLFYHSELVLNPI